MRIKQLFLSCLIGCLTFCAAPSQQIFSPVTAYAASSEPLASRTGFFFDTVISLSLYDTDDEAILDACFEQMDLYEKRLSRTREGSDIWNINHSGGQPTTVSEETMQLLIRALDYCELSDGLFDITIAPVVDLWDFHASGPVTAEDVTLPSSETIREALSHVDWHQVEIDEAALTVTLKDPAAEIDLGGIAKGWISGQLHDLLVGLDCRSALINLGGNMVTVGSKPDGSAWNIGIRRPFAEVASDVFEVVAVKDMAVITSGTYERYFVLDGQIYHHILDPRTGESVRNGLTSVSILTDDPTAGDALSTACFILGVEDGLKLIESLDGIEALWIDEALNRYPSSGWPGVCLG